MYLQQSCGSIISMSISQAPKLPPIVPLASICKKEPPRR